MYLREIPRLFLFAPLRAMTIHRITGTRNNYPQVDLCWKVLHCDMKNGTASAFLYLNRSKAVIWEELGGPQLCFPIFSLWTTKYNCTSDPPFKSASIDFNFRAQMEPWAMNDRMLLESRCYKSLKVGQQRISSKGTLVLNSFLVGFSKDTVSTVTCDDLYLSCDR